MASRKGDGLSKKVIDDIIKRQNELNSSTRDLKKEINEISDVYSDLGSVLNNVVSNSKIFGEEWGEVEDISKKILKNVENIGSEFYEQIDITEKMVAIAEKRKKISEDLREFERDETKHLQEKKKIQDDIKGAYQELSIAKSKGNKEEIRIALDMLAFNKQRLFDLETERKERELAIKAADALIEPQLELLRQLEEQNKVLDIAHEKAKKLGINIQEMADELSAPFEKVTEFIKSLPGGEFLSKAFGIDGLMDKVKKNVLSSFTKTLSETGSVGKASFAALTSGAGAFMASLGPILPIVLAIGAALALFKKALEVDQEVTDMARGLGTSKHEAEETHHELLGIAATTSVIGANSEELSKSYMELAKAMGVSKLANKEMAETQVYLAKQLEMSSEEASDFQKMSMAGGKSAYQNLAVIQAGVESMTGGLMNYKEVARDIAGASSEVKASYKGNIAALTKAVVTAKKFNMTLDATKASADGLLDIESSLESEMKARVLTGKNLDFNAARQLALAGDTAGAVENMMDQMGGYDELMSMAPYKQKALAESMNMTVEQMMDAARHQKNLNTMADELGITLDENGKMSEEEMARAMASNNEEAKKLAMQQQINSAQEKMAAIGDKLMAIFSKLAGPIQEMLDPIMNLVDFLLPAITAAAKLVLSPLTAIMGVLSGIAKMFSGDILGGIHDIGAAYLKLVYRPWIFLYDLLIGFFPSIGKLADEALGWIKDKVKGLLPDWALKLLGIDGSETSTSAPDGSETSTSAPEDAAPVSDGIISPSEGLVVSGPKGSYQLDPNDSIIAGTNLAPSGEQSSSGNSEIISLLKELIAKIDQPVTFNIGGRIIEEIGSQTAMRRSYSSQADSGYGAFV